MIKKRKDLDIHIFEMRLYNVLTILYFIMPFVAVYLEFIICKNYWKPYTEIKKDLIILSTYFSFYLIMVYYQLFDSYKRICSNKEHMKFITIKFVSLFILSIIMFAGAFIFVLIITKDGFSGIDMSSQLSIYVDILLFTLQNVVFQNFIPVYPTTPYSKIVVIVGIIYFTILISIVIFNLLNLRKSTNNE